MISRFLRFFPAIAWMILIFYLSSIQNLELQGDLSVYDFVLRKLAHITEYAILTVLLYVPLSKEKVVLKPLRTSITLTLLYAITDELHQAFVPTRDGKVVDVLIDSIGIFIAIIGIHVWLKKSQKTN